MHKEQSTRQARMSSKISLQLFLDTSHAASPCASRRGVQNRTSTHTALRTEDSERQKGSGSHLMEQCRLHFCSSSGGRSRALASQRISDTMSASSLRTQTTRRRCSPDKQTTTKMQQTFRLLKPARHKSKKSNILPTCNH